MPPLLDMDVESAVVLQYSPIGGNGLFQLLPEIREIELKGLFDGDNLAEMPQPSGMFPTNTLECIKKSLDRFHLIHYHVLETGTLEFPIRSQEPQEVPLLFS